MDSEFSVHERARELARQSGADIVIWGRILNVGGTPKVILFFVPSLASTAVHTSLQGADQIFPFPTAMREELGVAVRAQVLSTVLTLPRTSIDSPLALPVIAKLEQLASIWSDGENHAQFLLVLAGLQYRVAVITSDMERMKKAVAEYKEARTFMANTQNNNSTLMLDVLLGEALRSIGKMQTSIDAFVEAEQLESAALATVPVGEKNELRMLLLSGRGLSLELLGSRRLDEQLAAKAIYMQRLALSALPINSSEYVEACIHQNLGSALSTYGRVTANIRVKEEAEIEFEVALRSLRKSGQWLEWATTAQNAANNLTEIGVLSGRATYFQRAISAQHLPIVIMRRFGGLVPGGKCGDGAC
ncbi:MAG TPA: hypothetical protein VHD32_11495 [Candidatus Didemnitutus sp.]|nr:hypothetical protein [Candidatus Didemnitutus sp.]